MQRPLEGQVAIITGSVRRIGKATALALAREGAAIVVNARSSLEEAEQTAAEIKAGGARAHVHLADVTSEAAVKGLVDAALSQFGRIDVLVNNAAVRADTAFLDMTFAEWRAVTGIMLDGAFLCARAVLPHMVARRHGRIVNVGGISAHLGVGGRAHVVTGKAGLLGLTRALAAEFAGQGITVNCVVPGRIGGQRSATSGKGISGQAPVGREGVPEDVAEIIRMLCLPSTSYVTGQTIHVNGGMFMP
jgi:3-oxoacyl-[acyl-carrier protein] reductase